LYGDSHGSPGQDDHFDPRPHGSNPFEPEPYYGPEPFTAEPYGAEPYGDQPYGAEPYSAGQAEHAEHAGHGEAFEPGPLATDVKVAGTPSGDWSPSEYGDMDAYRPTGSPSRTGLFVKIGVAAAAAVVVLGGGVAFAMSGGSSSDTGKKASAAAPPKAAPQVPGTDALTLQNNADENARKIIQDRADRAARSDAKKAPPLSAKGATPTPTSSSSSPGANTPGASSPVTSNQAQAIAVSLMPGWGWDPKTQFNNCLKPMWNNESGWNVTASNGSGAYGIPQALPGSKMSSAGSDWQTSASTQIKWGFGYIRDRYGSPCQAWAFWQAHSWY
jgi:hypothetical protein